MAEKDCSLNKSSSSTGAAAAGQPAPNAPEVAAARVAAPAPPVTDRGVEFCGHWLSVTHWQDVGSVLEWVCTLIGTQEGAGAFTRLEHGARGFRELLIGPGGCKVYASPFNGAGFCSVEIPGEVLQSIAGDLLIRQFQAAQWRWQVTRFDLAFDHTLFVPADVLDAVMVGDVRTLAKRATLREFREPLKGKGGHTVYLGSRQSERMLRVYLRDDYTRVEMECKGERADLIFRDLLSVAPETWHQRALSHLRDFVDFKRDWWARFCGEVERAKMKLHNWAASSFNRSRAWLEKQVASTLAMLEDAKGFGEVVRLLDEGRKHYTARHRVILATCGVSI